MLLPALALATTALTAKAGGPMEQGTFTIGAERITGIMHADLKDSRPPPLQDVTNGVTVIALFGNGIFPALDARELYTMPRVGFDYFVIDGLSLGGSLTLIHAAGENDSQTGFLFAPRIGYAYMFSDVVGIWPRGGFSYAHVGESPDDPALNGESSHIFAFEIDVPLLIAPVKNFAITVGPLFDLTFGGSRTPGFRRGDPEPLSQDISLTMFGISAGLVGIL
jgi:hypothetical protein